MTPVADPLETRDLAHDMLDRIVGDDDGSRAIAAALLYVGDSLAATSAPRVTAAQPPVDLARAATLLAADADAESAFVAQVLAAVDDLPDTAIGVDPDGLSPVPRAAARLRSALRTALPEGSYIPGEVPF